MRASNPLYIDSTMTRAAVPMAMPTALIAEIMFITLWDFFANRYRLAKKNGRFMFL